MFYSVRTEAKPAHLGKNAICGTYNHVQYMEGRREMMQWYADYINSVYICFENRHGVVSGCI
ncbi:recombinase [Yersinia pseudotuberculosis]|nr:recombinase [Yersinia pseudotuberculosis]MBO1569488.1 recombinase [Yersinia pseudotuberculosis]MBO1584458.1 recombinase [Yersinia pseudotuberculosis]MBO1633881.1 recombinase [Yersinia pseudotuberculosis]